MIKKLIAFAIFTYGFTILAVDLHAQASGSSPQLYMYRTNGSANGSPLPVVAGDRLGTIEWRGLTALNATRLGATIKSNATFVSPGFLMGNLIFSTSGGAGLSERAIITESGLFGIGTMTPLYHLDVVGNTHTSGRFFGRIHMDPDQGNQNALPSNYIDEAYFERKQRADIGLAPLSGVGGTLSLAPGGGALDRQIFSGGSDGLWTRSQELNGANSWEAWEKILTSTDISGRSNLLARYSPPGPLSSSLRDGQVYDNGTNVVIGGMPAYPTPPSPVFDPADALTVSGRARVDGNTVLNGNVNVTGAASSSSLSVTNNTGTGTLSVVTDATVNGATRLVGKVAVGPGPVPTGGSPDHSLYVSGSMIAEEVVVKLKANWPDYVFENDYPLMPLNEVEKYVQENKCLPGVASQAEVAEKGQYVGETQRVQMEKIEELYLHLISMEKRIQTLEEENLRLKQEISQSQSKK